MSLNDVWVGAAGSPFNPVVAKERQFLVGFTLLLIGQFHSSFIKVEFATNIFGQGFVLTGLFSLSGSLN